CARIRAYYGNYDYSMDYW
nr:immunoglobulin heavy chain junction region [Mus musculus]